MPGQYHSGRSVFVDVAVLCSGVHTVDPESTEGVNRSKVVLGDGGMRRAASRTSAASAG